MNYNDTRPHPKWCFMRGISLPPPYFRLLKYHNSPSLLGRQQGEQQWQRLAKVEADLSQFRSEAEARVWGSKLGWAHSFISFIIITILFNSSVRNRWHRGVDGFHSSYQGHPSVFLKGRLCWAESPGLGTQQPLTPERTPWNRPMSGQGPGGLQLWGICFVGRMRRSLICRM